MACSGLMNDEATVTLTISPRLVLKPTMAPAWLSVDLSLPSVSLPPATVAV